jgi:small subunit ribosomal protein S20
MANIKSSIKDIKRIARNHARNQAVKSRMKTYIKYAEEALNAKDADRIQTALKDALSEIDRAATKGVIHPNTAARKKSSLQRRAAALASAS